jgi:membrane protein YdbS with pleckstrin-like domain
VESQPHAGESQHVDPNTVPVWRWQGVIFALLFCLPFVGFALRRGGALGGGLLLAYAVVAIVLVWRIPRAYYRGLEFAIDPHGITIRRGLLWRSHIALPRMRVQHSDVSQGPLQRRYGVATLKLYTAGSRYTRIELPGLEYGAAVALRDALIARGADSGV